MKHMENKLSVIIPSRSPQYLNQTINDLLTKAEGDVEVIVVLDGIWNDIVEDKRVTYIHHGTVHNNIGMREGINRGVAISKGKWIMKIDEHCLLDQGYDVKLEKDCEDNWVVVPRRYRLDVDNWKVLEDNRPPIDYMFIDYPYKTKGDVTDGLHGAKWDEMYHKRKDVMIDDLMTCQGSCYFMTRKHWDNTIKRMDDENYGPFTMEAQEITNKTWLSGGRCIVNKNTWYAHLHKGTRGKGYGFSTEQYKQFSKDKEKGRVYAINYWLSTKDFKYDFGWLIDKFMPLPNWPTNWRETIKEDSKYDFSLTGKKGFWLS